MKEHRPPAARPWDLSPWPCPEVALCLLKNFSSLRLWPSSLHCVSAGVLLPAPPPSTPHQHGHRGVPTHASLKMSAHQMVGSCLQLRLSLPAYFRVRPSASHWAATPALVPTAERPLGHCGRPGQSEYTCVATAGSTPPHLPPLSWALIPPRPTLPCSSPSQFSEGEDDVSPGRP